MAGLIARARKLKKTIVFPEGNDPRVLQAAARLVAEGVEARLAAADSGAEAEAEADRRELLDAQGTDANASETKVALIRKRFGEQPPAGS